MYTKKKVTISQILKWADDHHRRTGSWPKLASGPVVGAPEENWGSLNRALKDGRRGLAGNTTLAQLLADKRGARNSNRLPKFSAKQILQWADAHFQHTTRWPTPHSGEILEAPGETWSIVESALHEGLRGLPPGSSLAKLLAQAGRKQPHCLSPDLSPQQITTWAHAYYRREGIWPHRDAGQVLEATNETWAGINQALQRGSRGLPGGNTLARLLRRYHNLWLRTQYVPGRAQWARPRTESN
jgi:hypothetical protein